jgi:hypothetical protein
LDNEGKRKINQISSSFNLKKGSNYKELSKNSLKAEALEEQSKS